MRRDDAEENASIERACKDKCLCIKYDFSGSRITQRNGKVERKFQKLYERIRSMSKILESRKQ
jgi:hypothetical protein